jgi:O-antigen ligase
VESNLLRVLESLIRFSVVVAASLIVARLVILLSGSGYYLRTSGWGTYALLLPFSLLVMQVLLKQKSTRETMPVLLIISAGILQAFWKPVVFGFLAVPLLTFFLPLYSGGEIRVSVLGKMKRILPALILIVAIGLLLYSANADYYIRIFRLAYLKEGFAVQDYSGNRFTIWMQAIDQWIKSPVFGTGFGSILKGFLFHSSTGTYIYLDQIYVHNLAVQFLYQFGIVGLLIVVYIAARWWSMIGLTLRNVWKDWSGTYAGVVLFCILTIVISLIGEALRYSLAGFLFCASLGLEAAFASYVMKPGKSPF